MVLCELIIYWLVHWYQFQSCSSSQKSREILCRFGHSFHIVSQLHRASLYLVSFAPSRGSLGFLSCLLPCLHMLTSWVGLDCRAHSSVNELGKFRVGETLAEACSYFIEFLHVPAMCPWGLKSFSKAKFSQEIVRIQEKKNSKTHLVVSPAPLSRLDWHEIEYSNSTLWVLQCNMMHGKADIKINIR